MQLVATISDCADIERFQRKVSLDGAGYLIYFIFEAFKNIPLSLYT